MGDYFHLGCLFQSSGVLPGFKHGIHDTVKNNSLIEQEAWERGTARQFCWRVGRWMWRWNLYPEILGRVLFQKSYVVSKSHKDHGNTIPKCSFSEHCPVSALLWACLRQKQDASFEGLSQNGVCHFSVLTASLWHKGQGRTTRGWSQERLTMSKATERSKPEARERSTRSSYWEVLVIICEIFQAFPSITIA